MENRNQDKFEILAGFFHDKELQEQNRHSEMMDDAIDFGAVKDIYEAKGLVNMAAKISSVDTAWEKVTKRINKGRSFRYSFLFSYAAALIGIGIACHFFWKEHSLPQPHIQSRPAPEQYASVNSPEGLITVVTLCDGTKVWLNSGAELKYPVTFSKKHRNVSVEGEALFKVKKDKEHPFIVDLNESKIVVLGTTFNVKNYSGANKKEVVLVKGKIEYQNPMNNTLIKPGERIRDYKTTEKLSVDHVNTRLFTAWVDGKVYFEKERLSELVARLEKLYEVRFVWGDRNLREFEFTGVIDKNKSLEYNLQIIQLTNKVKFINRKDRIIVTN
ncbi:MAG: FecR domain-containing protein [Bacteroidota bacterium]|nr:FecR domain-containing protein [Bacteroidota bacterium]